MGWDLRLAWRAWLIGGLVALAAACESPTLPLPPPELPSVNTDGLLSTGLGQVKLSSQYGAEPNAIIITYNLDTNVPLDRRVGGAQADAFGSWDATIAAFEGDEIEVTQQVGAEMSPPETVVVP
jgi:hypothetical protein